MDGKHQSGLAAVVNKACICRIVCASIFLLVMFNPVLRSEISEEMSPPDEASVQAADPVQTESEASGDLQVVPQAEAPKGADEFDKIRDPFESSLPSAPVPIVTKKVKQQVRAATSASLEGISMTNKGGRAVINGLIYKENEEKNGIIVTQIRKKEVDILINGVTETLRLFEWDDAAGSVRK